MAVPEPLIQCHNLQKSYGRKQVLRGVDLEVPAGTIFALLGTNGAGKTTMIRTMLGLIPKSGGDLRVLGEEPYHLGARLRQRIGYVSEEQGLYGWMTVRGLIDFCRALYDVWDEELVRSFLDKFKLDPHARVKALSHGQTVKLALLLAMAPKPELLILDEPMTGLDPLAQHEFLQVVMRDINLEGRTIFFSTHILADVESTAGRVAILQGGRIAAEGTVPEIKAGLRKVVLKGESAALPAKAYLLSREAGASIALVPPEHLAEVAAAAEVVAEKPVSLEEAFVYHCAGEGQ